MHTTTVPPTLQWSEVIEDETAIVARDLREWSEREQNAEKGTEERNKQRNVLVAQSLSGVRGVLSDVLKDKAVREFVDVAFQKVPSSDVILCTGSTTEPKKFSIRLARTTETFTIDIRDETDGTLTKGWSVHSDVFYTLPDTFLPELGRLVDAEYLVRRIVRVLYRYR